MTAIFKHCFDLFKWFRQSFCSRSKKTIYRVYFQAIFLMWYFVCLGVKNSVNSFLKSWLTNQTMSSREILSRRCLTGKQVVPLNRNQNSHYHPGSCFSDLSTFTLELVKFSLFVAFTEFLRLLTYGVPQGFIHGPLVVLRTRNIRGTYCFYFY
jgi:hypothetical protein